MDQSTSVDELESSEEVTGAETVTDVPVEPFAASGSLVDHVEVAISYGIIERFSEGLYSSPNKTFEELVTNSYDAGAKTVWVYLPADLHDSSKSIVVIDDGQSMDLEGLRDLWNIGESRKRLSDDKSGRKNPVGKFGIGKLATYVLAEKLTYITHRDGEYLAVTMDYGRVSSDSSELLKRNSLRLEVISLSRDAAIAAVEASLEGFGGDANALKALRAGSGPKHWTAAVLTNLKETAGNIVQGRLRWVLRTALPLNPDFVLWYNDDRLESSKVSGKTLWSFQMGKNENTLPVAAEKPWRKGTRTTAVDDEGNEVAAFKLPTAGVVWGNAVLYEKALERGKSEEQGRSHGIFVRVRGRLINQNSADFDLGPELRHGTLTRFHMEINADGLDDEVASARESLKESPKLSELKVYMLAIFNKARNVASEDDSNDHIPLLKKDGSLTDPPPALSQAPLRRLIQRAVDGDEGAKSVLGIRDEDIEVAGTLLNSGGDLLGKVIVDDLGDSRRLVAFDPYRQAAVVNQSHPFVSNYLDVKQAGEVLRLVALTELLTEAYMIDEGVSMEVVSRVMARRDDFLRELARRNPRSAHVIATNLRDSINNEKALEDAVASALDLLGYQVRKLGGANHGTDGIATARLGMRAEPRSDSYAFTYDAKSSGKNAVDALRDAEDVDVELLEETISAARPKVKRIRADTARTSILKVHREKAAQLHGLEVVPEFTLLVAPGFQGQDDEEALINDVCVNDGITAITVEDLAVLIELFPLQGINPVDLRSLFDRKTPADTHEWILEQRGKAGVSRPPVANIIEIIVKWSERRAQTDISALNGALSIAGHNFTNEEVQGLVRGLSALAPKSFFTDGTVVALNATPAALVREIGDNLSLYDQELVGAFRDSVRDATEE